MIIYFSLSALVPVPVLSNFSYDTDNVLNEEGEVVIAFQGTSGSGQDWSENILDSLTGISHQIKSMIFFYDEVRNLDGVDPEKITLTGHSLGGKLAQRLPCVLSWNTV